MFSEKGASGLGSLRRGVHHVASRLQVHAHAAGQVRHRSAQARPSGLLQGQHHPHLLAHSGLTLSLIRICLQDHTYGIAKYCH